MQTDVILLDFCKAFDKVPHHLLLHKLYHYGIRGSTFKWISSFLSGRIIIIIIIVTEQTAQLICSGKKSNHKMNLAT